MCHKGFQRRKELMTSAFEKFTVYQQTKKKKKKKQENSSSAHFSPSEEVLWRDVPCLFFSFPWKTAQSGLMVGLDYLSALSNLNDAMSLQKEKFYPI